MDVENNNYYASTPTLIEAIGDIGTDHKVDLASAQNQRSFAGMTYPCARPPGFEGPLQCLAVDLGDRCYLTAHVSREAITFKGDIMHDKFVVIDERYVWTGSTNASNSGTGGYNANQVWLVDSPTVAGWYRNEFEQMFTEGRYHASKESRGPMRTSIGDDVQLEVLFSPQDKPITNNVIPLVRQAHDRIDIAVFFLTHKKLAQELIWAHNRGVQVRVILDATAATNGYTKHEILRAAGIPVKIEDWGGKMHAKSAVIDGHTVIAGSMNWTNAGEWGNDENTIIVRSERHAKQYQQWFDGLWAQISDRWLQGRPDPESRDSGTACQDGVDNDYDDLDDTSDPGCSATPPPLPALPPFTIVKKPAGSKCDWDMLDKEDE
jgi:phosphatidylserine/phosphatidylglycerophosphate/cardiolipin synthase-like enzyme